MTDLTPTDTIIIEQEFEAAKIALRQFKKTPNIEVGSLLASSARQLEITMMQYVTRLQKERNRVIKINGESRSTS